MGKESMLNGFVRVEHYNNNNNIREGEKSVNSGGVDKEGQVKLKLKPLKSK